MNIVEFKNSLNKLVCQLLNTDKFDNDSNILGKVAAYDVLYIINFMECQCGVTAKELFIDLEYTDMSINGIANKVYSIIGN